MSPESPRLLALGLLITRTLVHRLLLRPKEGLLTARNPSPRGKANLRMLSAMMYVLGKAVPLQMLRPEVRAGRLQRLLKQDDEAVAPFRGELDRLIENGLPLLDEWMWEAAEVLRLWVQGMLHAARAAAAAKGLDEADG